MPRKNDINMQFARNRRSGFTLIELLIVMVAIAILAAIAIPGFAEAIKRVKRTEGRSALLQLMQQQERYYSLNTTYLAFSSGMSGADEKRFKWYSGDNPANSAYELSAVACEGDTIKNCVVISARPGTPKVDKGFKDAVCGTLTLSSNGEKTPDDKRCW